LYIKIGEPVVTSSTLWTIFRQLLQQFRSAEENIELTNTLAAHVNILASLQDEKMPLLPNMKPFRNGAGIVGPKGSHYAGGLANPPGATGSSNGEVIAQPEYADFTDSGDEDSGVE
jgi:hypothetical protein